MIVRKSSVIARLFDGPDTGLVVKPLVDLVRARKPSSRRQSAPIRRTAADG